MIGEAYKKIEEVVDKLDREMDEKYSSKVQEIYLRKYDFLENCTQQIKGDDSKKDNELFQKCLKKSDEFDIVPYDFLENHKEELYSCIN